MRKILFAVLVLLPWLSMACMDSHENMSPVKCFETAYQLGIEGKYDQTAPYFTDAILDYMKKNPDMTLQKIWDAKLNGGTVKLAKVIEKQADDKNCDVKFMINGPDGMTDAEDTLVFERGSWKFDKMTRVR